MRLLQPEYDYRCIQEIPCDLEVIRLREWKVARIGFAVFLTLAYALSIMNWQDYISITPGVRSGKPLELAPGQRIG